jgi:class 3 adenylate cyclase/streptogramin lyase
MASRTSLVTVMFTDIVNSTDIAGEMGDRRWRELIARHHRIVRSELRRFGGREIDTAGDGFFAAFDRPAEAVRCACSIVQAVRTLGIEVRAGVHVGEAEVMGKGLSGMAVHTGARIAALGGPGEVLVSGTLRDLVPGATFGFDDRGVRQLKGVREAPRVLAVTEVDETPVAPPVDGHEAAARRRAIAAPPAYRRRPVWIAALAITVLLVGAVALVAAIRDEPTREAAVTTDALAVVDPTTRQVRETVPVPPAYPITYESAQVAVGEGGVWVMTGTCVCHLDPELGRVSQADIRTPNQMALGHRAVWAATLDNLVIAIDPADLETSDPIEVADRQVFHTSITTTTDAVWIAFSNELARIDPVTEVVSEPIDLSHGADDIVGVGNDVWVVDQLARRLYRYESNGEAVQPAVQLQVTPDDVVAGPDGALWVLNRSGGTVTRVDPESGPDQPIRVGADPSDLAVGPDAVWVADREGRTIQRIDPTLGQPDDPIRLPGPVAAIGVDPTNGEVWAYLS